MVTFIGREDEKRVALIDSGSLEVGKECRERGVVIFGGLPQSRATGSAGARRYSATLCLRPALDPDRTQ